MRLSHTVSGALLLTCLFVASVACACQCDGFVPVPTPAEAFAEADAVMEIEVMGASPFNGILGWDLYYVRVLRSWKGVTSVETRVTMPIMGACGFPLPDGARRLIYGEGPIDRLGEGSAWYTELCTRSAQYQTSADLEYLESLEQVVSGRASSWGAVKSIFGTPADDATLHDGR